MIWGVPNSSMVPEFPTGWSITSSGRHCPPLTMPIRQWLQHEIVPNFSWQVTWSLNVYCRNTLVKEIHMTGCYPLELIPLDFHFCGDTWRIWYIGRQCWDTSRMVLPSCGKIMKACRQEHAVLKQPWLRFFHAFSSVVRQMPGCNLQRRGMASTLPN